MNFIKGRSRLLLLVMVLLTGCKGVEDITMTGISDLIFTGMENNSIKFSALVGVSNPSSLPFRITELNLRTLVEGNFLGTLTTDDKIKILAHSDTTYRVSFTLTMANMLSGASYLYGLSRREQLDLTMQGYVKARSWLTTRKKTVNETRRIDVPSF
jgi:LEA14-like dessication related protein